MKTITDTKYHVVLSYDIVAEDASKAIDECLGKHPLKPVSINCDPIDKEDEDD